MPHGTEHDLGQHNVPGPDGEWQPLEVFLEQSHTNSCVILHQGRPVYEWAAPGCAAHEPLPVFSITKSVVGVLAGVLMERGDLDPDVAATRYVPELAHGGYRNVSVRDLLDMRTGGGYLESLEAGSELDLLASTFAADPATPYRSVLDLVARIERFGLHDGPFSYRSMDTEALGVVIERAAGAPMSALVHNLVLQPLGIDTAAFAVHPSGEVSPSGGLVISARDLGTFGAMILNSGAHRDRQIVSPFFVKDLRIGHPGDNELAEGRGSYRNQFWVPVAGGRELLALGIYGQMLWMDAASDVVFAKVSAWPQPSDPALLSTTYAVAQACAAALTEEPPRDITLPH